MLHKIQVAILILIFPLGGLYLYLDKNNIPLTREIFYPGVPVVHIGEIPMQVEIADTKEERDKGLSGRKDLKNVNGMLFVFDTTDYHGIWMKDMRFPIDVIWVSEDLKVISVERNLQPSSYPKSFIPPTPARYAIETNPNYADTFGIVPGKSVVLPINLRND